MTELPSLDDLAARITGWHHARNLVAGSTHAAQMLKLAEEHGELAAAVARGEDVEDHIGDMIVVLANIAARENTTLRDCAAKAYADIKDRRGRMVDGVFIKEEQ